MWGPNTEKAADDLGFTTSLALIEGIDVSAFCCDNHGRSLIDWDRLDPKPRFVIARTSFGVHKDGASDGQLKDARSIGAITGVYHFYEASEDPIKQAKVWFAAAGPQPCGSTFQPAIDFENNRENPLTPTEAQHWAMSGRALILAAEQLFQRSLMIYINPKTAREMSTYLDDFWSRRLLWVAAYTGTPGVAPVKPWKSVAVHQFAGDVHMPGATRVMVDRNAVFGEDTFAQLLQ